MTKHILSNSLRKFIRKKKANLRREILNPKEAEKQIQEFVVKTFSDYTKNKGLKKLK